MIDNYFVLANNYIDCPIYWQKFIDHFDEKDWEDDSGVSDKAILRELKKFRGKYVIERDGRNYLHKVVFEDAKDHTMFMLKWS